MKRYTRFASLAVLCMLAAPAAAQVRVRDHRSPAHERFERAPAIPARNAKVDRKRSRKAKRAPRPFYGAPARTHSDPVWKTEQELSKTRRSRRTGSAARLRTRWNRTFLVSPQVRAELELHARRIARLERMLRLAHYRQRAGLRIQVAIWKENARHDRRMSRLAMRRGRGRRAT